MNGRVRRASISWIGGIPTPPRALRLPSPFSRRWLACLFALATATLTACNEQPPDLREWHPSDHDHTTNPGNDQVEGGPDAGTAPELAAHGLNEVVIVAWEQNCVRCHGRFGRGDGPQGPMVHAADLTNAKWQATASDDDIFKFIRDGRGLMPAFPLPDETLRALVQLIRLLGQATAPGASASAAPAGSAPRSPHALTAAAASASNSASPHASAASPHAPRSAAPPAAHAPIAAPAASR
jgi:cytochrome c oxidase cbb3-type subunit 3